MSRGISCINLVQPLRVVNASFVKTFLGQVQWDSTYSGRYSCFCVCWKKTFNVSSYFWILSFFFVAFFIFFAGFGFGVAAFLLVSYLLVALVLVLFDFKYLFRIFHQFIFSLFHQFINSSITHLHFFHQFINSSITHLHVFINSSIHQITHLHFFINSSIFFISSSIHQITHLHFFINSSIHQITHLHFFHQFINFWSISDIFWRYSLCRKESRVSNGPFSELRRSWKSPFKYVEH